MPATKPATPNGSAILHPFTGLEQANQFAQTAATQTLGPIQKIMGSNLDTAAELLAFVSRRLRVQAAHWHQLSQCKSVDEALGLQKDFVAALTSDYTKEGSRLVEMTQESVATSVIPPAREKAARGQTAM